MNNSLFEDRILHFKDVRSMGSVIFYLFVIAISAMLFVSNYLTQSSALLNIFSIIGISMGFISILLSRKNADLLFLINTLVIFAIIIYAKFSIVYQNGLSIIILLVELAFCISVIFYFDYKKSMLIPIILVLVGVVESIYLDKVQQSELNTIIESDISRITTIAILLFVFVYTFSAFFVNRMRHLLKKYSKSEDDLTDEEKYIEAQHAALTDCFKRIQDQSTKDSHKLRAPITRIEGLLSLHEASLDMDEEERATLQTELNKSLEELRRELELFERTLCDAKAIMAKT